ncbi:MAG: segregation and condensation protein A [Mycoplasmatales bacterium]
MNELDHEGQEKIVELSEDKYNFDLDVFEGPLDVLLHLAKTQRIEIADISLDELIVQYIEYIETVQDQGINIASEYIEMAAELIRLKSSSLLPGKDSELIDELEEAGFSREDLIARLIEYKKYTDIAQSFNDLHDNKLNEFYKKQDSMKDYRDVNFKDSVDIDVFKRAVESLVYKQSQIKEESRVIEVNELNVEEMYEHIKNLDKEVMFTELIKGMNITSKVSTFLALLEGMKHQIVEVISLDHGLKIIPKESNE